MKIRKICTDAVITITNIHAQTHTKRTESNLTENRAEILQIAYIALTQTQAQADGQTDRQTHIKAFALMQQHSFRIVTLFDDWF